MINVEEFYLELERRGVDFFCGIPDSLLKSFCAYISDHCADEKNIITSNEGAAVALAAGYHIGTGKIPLVYMQNSGLGNAVNPLMSLADSEVYSIPLLLLIGWRGEPGVHDEPQHVKQGKVTLNMLDTMGIPASILSPETDLKKEIDTAIEYCSKKYAPYAIVVKKNTFSQYKSLKQDDIISSLSREKALETVLDNIPNDSIIVSTTGMLSRELFELREKRKEPHFNDFLTVGSMGHTSQIAMGLAIAHPDKEIYCFEGDGAAIMHMGSYPIVSSYNLPNLKIILFNNGAHDSVGGQPTVGLFLDFVNIFKTFGFLLADTAKNEESISNILGNYTKKKERFFLQIIVNKGARKDLGRPTQSPLKTKEELMTAIKNGR